MHLRSSSRQSSAGPLSRSETSPVPGDWHVTDTQRQSPICHIAEHKQQKSAVRPGVTPMTDAQTSALGRLAKLAGVRTEHDVNESGQSTASLLEEAVSNAETDEAASSLGPLSSAEIDLPASAGVASANATVESVAPARTSSQATSSTSSPYFSPASIQSSAPITAYQTSSGYPTPSFASPQQHLYEQQPHFPYYAAHGHPAGFYPYQAIPYGQLATQASPENGYTASSESGLVSPGPSTSEVGYYAHAQPVYPHAPPNMYYYGANELHQRPPDTDVDIASDHVTQSQYYTATLAAAAAAAHQPQPYPPSHQYSYFGMPAYPPAHSPYYPAQTPQLFAQQQYDPGRHLHMLASAHPLMTAAAGSPTAYQPQPLPELARGHLAQSRLHDAAYNRPPAPRQRGSAGARSALPKPPPHSEYALWVGNVPGDSNHAELWRFFTSRSGPGGTGSTTGVESIHLISRSNCAFVNYSSQANLDHAIQVCNGMSLRPGDPRVKDLVCRVRRKEDDAKSGVGAQRGRGMHQQYVRDQDATEAVPPATPASVVSHSRNPSDVVSSPSKDDSAGGSVSTASTNSSFLTARFPRRFFILKSHTEDDLRLSQERGLWATQPHNEPILDQAFRTASEGVFLIFSANKSGEFFGYAKMTSHIFNKPSSTSGSGGSSRMSNPPVPPEVQVLTTSSSMAQSPQPLMEHSHEPEGGDPVLTDLKPRGASDPTPSSKPTGLRATAIATESQRGSAPSHMPASMAGAMAQLSLGPSHMQPTEADDDGIIRRDMVMTPEERNARLEQMVDEADEEASLAAAAIHVQRELSQKTAKAASNDSGWDPGWGRPFKVQWIELNSLPFSRVKHLRNAFNGNREIRVARDGTEIEPICGAALLREFARAVPPQSPRSPFHRAPSLPTSPRMSQLA